MNLVSQKYGDVVQWEIRQWGEIKKGFTHFSEGDVALAKITPCFQNGKSCVMQGLKNKAGAGTTELHIFRPIKNLTCSEYVLIYFKSPKFISDAIPIMTGTAGQKRVPNSYVSTNPFPMPPFAEQKRIVEKCDRLLSICDEIEKRQQQRQESIVRMNESAIAQLLSSQNPDEFSQHWQRICNNFDLLYSIPETIPKLRQAILQLAVQGKLVRQDPNDEPASLLLEEIRSRRKQLINDKKIKDTRSLPVISQNEIHYTIPANWSWARLADICELITDGTHYTPKYTEHGRMFLSAQNVKPFCFMPENHKFVSEEAYQGYVKNRKPEFEDILLTRVGAGIGEAAVIDQKLEFAIYVSLGLIRPFKEFIHPYYLTVWLNSPTGTLHSQKNTYGKGVSQGNLNLGLIRGFVVSVPPVAEQKRIVAKVDHLMSLCDTLETKLKEARSRSEMLMEVAAKQILTT